MLQTSWKVNLRHLKENIDSNYMQMLDLHKKNLAYLIITGLIKRERKIANIYFEDFVTDSYYRSLVERLSLTSTYSLEGEILGYYNSLPDMEKLVFCDLALYVDEFIEKFLMDIGVNMITVTFNFRYELIVVVKCITNIKAIGRDPNQLSVVRWVG